MTIHLEEHTSLRGVNRVDIGSLAKQKKVYVESDGSMASVGTGSFAEELTEYTYIEKEGTEEKEVTKTTKITKGSIRIGALVKKKEDTEEGQ